MARRRDHPLKTLALLLVVAALGWAAYEFLYVRGILRTKPRTFVAQEVLDGVRDVIVDAYAANICFLELGPVHYRPKEDHYRVEFTVADECIGDARGICEDIAHLVQEEVNDSVGVFAFNRAGNPVAWFVD